MHQTLLTQVLHSLLLRLIFYKGDSLVVAFGITPKAPTRQVHQTKEEQYNGINPEGDKHG